LLDICLIDVVPDLIEMIVRVFPTVEKRWIKEHPACKSLPDSQELVESLLTELGLFHSTDFKDSRDSCSKKLEAPLFWIPCHSDRSTFWPVIIIECQNRLLCSIPFLKQSQRGNNNSTVQSPDLTIILDLLSKLTPIVNLSTTQMNIQLTNIIQERFPYGRVNNSVSDVHTKTKPIANQKGIWKRSKPKLEIQIKEEIRVILSNQPTSRTAELYGTINLLTNQGDLSDIKLNLTFTKLSKPVGVLFHSCTRSSPLNENKFLLSVEPGTEDNILLCHYNVTLNDIPLKAEFKTKTVGVSTSIFMQLKIVPSLRSILTRLEVRTPMPAANRITKIVSAISGIVGAVSIQKDDTQLLWNLSPLILSNKLKEDVTMNVDIETVEPLSLANIQSTIMFVAAGSTLSGAQISLPHQSDLKLVHSKSLIYNIIQH